MGAWVWHSKVDKIVNNFHGQNRFQFHSQTPIFILIFVVKTDFLMFRPTNFLDHKISWSQNFLINLHSIPMPKISCPTLFHSIFMLNSVPFQQHFMVSHDFMVSDSLDLPHVPAPEVSHAFVAYLWYRLSVHWEHLQYFTDDVGSRVIRQVST